MMVGLAALALFGGVLIAVSRLLPEPSEQTSQATATPAQSVDAGSPSPRPSRSPPPARTMTVDPAIIPSAGEPSQFRAEWVRMRTDVKLLSSASSTAHPGASLHRGDAVFLYEAPPDEGGVVGWLRVDPMRGWMQADIGNKVLFQHFPYRGPSFSDVYRLSSSPSGYTAFSWKDAGSDQVLMSTDGAHWQASQGAPAVDWGRMVAIGPAGWLMAGNLDNPEGTDPMLWQSSDGRAWQALGVLPPSLSSGSSNLVGTDAGYVLTTYSGSGAASVWFSADGLLWTERPTNVHASDGLQVAATPLGFFIWDLTPPPNQAEGAFSADGWTWSQADLIGPGQVIDVVADGDHLLALGRSPGGARMWWGRIDGSELTWSSDNTAPFRGAAVRSMVSDGERVIVLGWQRDTEDVLWWQRNGLSWQRLTMPEDFGGLPQLAVGGRRGVVAVGRATSTGGAAPVFWHLGPGVRWEREPVPVIPAPPPLTAEACGPPPDDTLALMSLDGLLAANCFGDTPITVRGWAQMCMDCYGQADGRWRTKWLAQPTGDRVIQLAPIESAQGAYLEGILHPSLDVRGPPISGWLEMTGHFDDGAARSCGFTPTVMDEDWYLGTADIVASCRRRFVVTSFRPVNGP